MILLKKSIVKWNQWFGHNLVQPYGYHQRNHYDQPLRRHGHCHLEYVVDLSRDQRQIHNNIKHIKKYLTLKNTYTNKITQNRNKYKQKILKLKQKVTETWLFKVEAILYIQKKITKQIFIIKSFFFAKSLFKTTNEIYKKVTKKSKRQKMYKTTI